jgi:hypothetical protein
MQSLVLRLVMPALVSAALACGGESFTPTTDTVVGSYTATTLTITSTTPPTDALALGLTLTLTLAPNGTTTGRLFLPGGGDNGVDLDEDLSGTWTLDGHSVRFNQGADTFIRDAVFIAGPNTLSTEGTFGDTSLRLVLTKVTNGEPRG